jgi:hypothetical protein
MIPASLPISAFALSLRASLVKSHNWASRLAAWRTCFDTWALARVSEICRWCHATTSRDTANRCATMRYEPPASSARSIPWRSKWVQMQHMRGMGAHKENSIIGRQATCEIGPQKWAGRRRSSEPVYSADRKDPIESVGGAALRGSFVITAPTDFSRSLDIHGFPFG